MQAEDESNITELEILPDGRICVFGASREVLEIFKEMPIQSQSMILQRLKQHDMIGLDDVSSTKSADKIATIETQRNQS